MSQQKKSKTAASSQHQKFIDLAREIGADEDEAAFKERLKRLAKAKPKKDPSDQ